VALLIDGLEQALDVVVFLFDGQGGVEQAAGIAGRVPQAAEDLNVCDTMSGSTSASRASS